MVSQVYYCHYFWSQAYAKGEWRDVAKRLAEEANDRLSQVGRNSVDFVHYSAKAYKLFALSGDIARARSLALDLRAELREAGRRLYHAKDYKLAFEFLDSWLQIESSDRDSRWFKARCLTRLERYEDCEKELKTLEEQGYIRYRTDHAWGLLRRAQGRLSEAAQFFHSGLHDRPDYPPLLRDLGDVLDRMGDEAGALTALSRAYDLSPRDPYTVPKYVDVLYKAGHLQDAIAVLDGAIGTFPEQAALFHRKSILLEKMGDIGPALEAARRAFKLNPRLYEAVSHLASLEAKVDNLDEAERLIRRLPDDIGEKHSRVKRTISAAINLRRRDFEAASSSLSYTDITEDPYCAVLSVRIKIEAAVAAFPRSRDQAAALLRSAQRDVLTHKKRFSKDRYVRELEDRIRVLGMQFNVGFDS